MATYDRDPYGFLEIRSAAREAQKENTARQARTSITYTTTGLGSMKAPSVLDLGVTFTREPVVTTGYALHEDDDLVDDSYPQAFCGVYEWKRDSRGFYTGAWVFFVVTVTGAKHNYKIHHHLAFQGMAMKDLPAHLLDD